MAKKQRKQRKPQLSRVSIQYDVFVRLQAMANERNMDIPDIIRHLVEMSAIQQASDTTSVLPIPTATQEVSQLPEPIANTAVETNDRDSPAAPPLPTMQKAGHPITSPTTQKTGHSITRPATRHLGPVTTAVPPSTGTTANAANTGNTGKEQAPVSPAAPLLYRPARNMQSPPQGSRQQATATPIASPDQDQIRKLEEQLRELSLLIDTAPTEKRDELAFTYAQVTAALADLRRSDRR